MKKKDLAEVKKIDIKATKEKASQLKKELAKLVMEKNMGKLSNVKTIKNKRKDLAQILTVLKQKELLGNLKEVKSNG